MKVFYDLAVGNIVSIGGDSLQSREGPSGMTMHIIGGGACIQVDDGQPVRVVTQDIVTLDEWGIKKEEA